MKKMIMIRIIQVLVYLFLTALSLKLMIVNFQIIRHNKKEEAFI